MKYLRFFQTENDYETYCNSDEYVLPNISLIEDSGMLVMKDILIDNNIVYGSINRADTYNYFISEYPVNSDITITASFHHPINGLKTYVYHINKGNVKTNETISQAAEWENVIVEPKYDDMYNYTYIGTI